MNVQMTGPYSNDIWDPVETWSRDQIEEFQLSALKKQLARVEAKSAHYGNIFKQARFSAADFKRFEDLRRLPITRKADYVTGLQEDPPFGTMRAVELNEA
ncbi:MAG: phenylacetate--CoA ligase family protein, partial [Pseudomonadota bacterium]|nr:phenylacetate--CoA ligase family protein [Pseudomonadota bacterium]